MLYDQLRPQRFGDVMGGSGALVRAVAQRIRDGHHVHSLVFAGPKGSGKTTSARLLARAANCESWAGEPCGVCAGCRFSSGQPGLIEYDAAALSGADSVREMVSGMRMIPASNYVTYIIDEAHNLSATARDVLLKPIEEPRDRVLVVLCTTERHKITPTILSRCVQVSFKTASLDELVSHARAACAYVGLPATEDELRDLAGAADGSYRQLLSTIELAAACGTISMAMTNVSSPLVKDMVAALRSGDIGLAAELVRDRRAEYDNCINMLGEVFKILVGEWSRDRSIQGSVDLLSQCIMVVNGKPQGLQPWVAYYSLASKVA